MSIRALLPTATDSMAVKLEDKIEKELEGGGAMVVAGRGFLFFLLARLNIDELGQKVNKK